MHDLLREQVLYSVGGIERLSFKQIRTCFLPAQRLIHRPGQKFCARGVKGGRDARDVLEVSFSKILGRISECQNTFPIFVAATLLFLPTHSRSIANIVILWKPQQNGDHTREYSRPRPAPTAPLTAMELHRRPQSRSRPQPTHSNMVGPTLLSTSLCRLLPSLSMHIIITGEHHR